MYVLPLIWICFFINLKLPLISICRSFNVLVYDLIMFTISLSLNVTIFCCLHKGGKASQTLYGNKYNCFNCYCLAEIVNCFALPLCRYRKPCYAKGKRRSSCERVNCWHVLYRLASTRNTKLREALLSRKIMMFLHVVGVVFFVNN